MNSIFKKHILSFKPIVLSSLPHKHTLDLKFFWSPIISNRIFLNKKRKKINLQNQVSTIASKASHKSKQRSKQKLEQGSLVTQKHLFVGPIM